MSSFVSHGAMVDVGGMQCYVPLAGLAVPAPRRAREVRRAREHRQFVLVALDPARRGAELALPEIAPQRLGPLTPRSLHCHNTWPLPSQASSLLVPTFRAGKQRTRSLQPGRSEVDHLPAPEGSKEDTRNPPCN